MHGVASYAARAFAVRPLQAKSQGTIVFSYFGFG